MGIRDDFIKLIKQEQILPPAPGKLQVYAGWHDNKFHLVMKEGFECIQRISFTEEQFKAVNRVFELQKEMEVGVLINPDYKE